jgi:type IV secretory pathway VirB10-like protein
MAQSISDNKFAIRFILIAVAALILLALIMQYSKQSKLAVSETEKPIKAREQFEEAPVQMKMQSMPTIEQPVKAAAPEAPQDQATSGVRPSEPLSNEDYKAVDFETENKMPTECFPRDRLTTEDLLPKDAANSKWAQVNPAGQGEVKDQNFLTAGFHIGVNTVGQTLRNPNYQLRSEPANPRVQVSPWNQTTIEYDSGRKSFEIGEC